LYQYHSSLDYVWTILSASDSQKKRLKPSLSTMMPRKGEITAESQYTRLQRCVSVLGGDTSVFRFLKQQVSTYPKDEEGHSARKKGTFGQNVHPLSFLHHQKVQYTYFTH